MWSRIQDTRIGEIAKKYIKDNSKQLGLSYHNYQHVLDMYDYYEKTTEPYNTALDIATLFHDAIYDALPDKELRSAEWCKNICMMLSISHSTIIDAVAMIRATQKHIVTHSNLSAIIRADLHQLTDKKQVEINRERIFKESANLYRLPTSAIAAANTEFLQGLAERQERNIKFDSNYADFYKQVIDGIKYSISLNQ